MSRLRLSFTQRLRLVFASLKRRGICILSTAFNDPITMTTPSPNIQYLIAIIAVSGVLLLIALRLLRKWQNKRETRLSNKKFPRSAVRTESSFKTSRKDVQESAAESLQSRFSIIRRLFILIFLVLFLAATSIPFLGSLPTAFISVFVAAVSVFVGIASKPFLENFIAGIVLTFSKPFRVGDTVLLDQEQYGTIEDITMTYTIVKLWDWKRYVVPNSQMMVKQFINLTLKDNHLWSYVEFWVAPDTDIALVEKVAIKAAEGSGAFTAHEKPQFWVMGMEQKAMRCWVAAWADSPANAWQLTSDIRLELISQFKILKISPSRVSVDIHGSSTSP